MAESTSKRIASWPPTARLTLGNAGVSVGRIWSPQLEGPSPVAVRGNGVFDISSDFATMSELCEESDPASALAQVRGSFVGDIADILANTEPETRDEGKPWLLAPVDLQTLKAAGVTFVVSLIERVIEERVHGDVAAAALMRERILDEIGADLRDIRPGSERAGRLKEFLVGQGLWSQYLEVGIGPDAEIFTKAPTLSAVGTGTAVGVLAASTWNNPEPEVALVVQSTGKIVGATLGNDVNLRDFEGRSALLLTKAKDNNASCAIGPFVRLFDESFDLEVVRLMSVRFEIDGVDGFHLEGVSEMSEISRDPADLVAQLIGAHHQYPDGAVLMLGTMFAPVNDRDVVGLGFTHKEGDVVRISTEELGSLTNRVQHSENCEPWTFGVGALMRNLAERDLL